MKNTCKVIYCIRDFARSQKNNFIRKLMSDEKSPSPHYPSIYPSLIY